LGAPLSSCGDGFLFHDSTGTYPQVEQELTLDAFPSPEELWQRYRQWNGMTSDCLPVVAQSYFVLFSTRMGYTPLTRFSLGSERPTNERHRAGRQTELWPWATQFPQFGAAGIFAAALLRWLNEKLYRSAL
jgi:hypothetical protein